MVGTWNIIGLSISQNQDFAIKKGSKTAPYGQLQPAHATARAIRIEGR
jgi:hypothetical protein